MKRSIYQIFPRVELPNRNWPNQTLSNVPTWCSIDLRDANQSLPKPMSIDNKIMLFSFLVSLGFKQIEVGTPGRSPEDALFVRQLIEEKLIPSDVTIQVTTQLIEAGIDATLNALKGCENVIINLCQSVSSLRREEIFDMKESCLLERIESNIQYGKKQAALVLANENYQWAFSVEGFNTTEPNFLALLCQRVITVIAPSVEKPMILTFLAAVETDLPNYFADQIEWLLLTLQEQSHVIFSVQTHNDRGSAVASTELALLAGIERVEGCLLGHGERAGACCLLTLALNLYTHGLDIDLDFSNIAQVVSVFEHCTDIDVSPRHPYAGELVFAAFSAPHQFAIKEAYMAYCQSDKSEWHVPYLPMDPSDVGRGNDDVIRLNALSGRSGIAYVMEKSHGYRLPKNMQHEFSAFIKLRALEHGGELTSEQVWEYFAEHYFKGKKTFELNAVSFEKSERDNKLSCEGEVVCHQKSYPLIGMGTGALDTVMTALKKTFGLSFDVLDYHQHALGHGSNATAVSYLQIIDSNNDKYWGVGVDSDTTLATLDALFCALNRKMDNE